MAQLEALRVTRQEKVLAKGTHAKVLENLKMQMQSIWGSAKMKPELESVLKEVEKLSEVAKT
jgi:hypothetical protein